MDRLVDRSQSLENYAEDALTTVMNGVRLIHEGKLLSESHQRICNEVTSRLISAITPFPFFLNGNLDESQAKVDLQNFVQTFIEIETIIQNHYLQTLLPLPRPIIVDAYIHDGVL